MQLAPALPLGAGVFLCDKRGVRSALPWGLLLAVGAFGWFSWSRPSPHTLHRDPEQLTLTSASGYQTVSRLDGGATGLYYDAATDLLRGRTGVSVVVLLGLGGGEMLRQAQRVAPDAVLVGVDIDAHTVELARTEFHAPGLLLVSDAIDWVDIWPPERVSVVMVDLYNDSEIVPAATRLTFLAGCYRLLRPGGLFMMNVWPASRADEISAVLATLYPKVQRRSYGPNVVLFADRP